MANKNATMLYLTMGSLSTHQSILFFVFTLKHSLRVIKGKLSQMHFTTLLFQREFVAKIITAVFIVFGGEMCKSILPFILLFLSEYLFWFLRPFQRSLQVFGVCTLGHSVS